MLFSAISDKAKLSTVRTTKITDEDINILPTPTSGEAIPPTKYPMSIFVKLSMDGDTGFNWNRILALSLISIIPQLIVFFAAQDAFIDGIAAGSVKG